jgi:hypothetical protein
MTRPGLIPTKQNVLLKIGKFSDTNRKQSKFLLPTVCVFHLPSFSQKEDHLFPLSMKRGCRSNPSDRVSFPLTHQGRIVRIKFLPKSFLLHTIMRRDNGNQIIPNTEYSIADLLFFARIANIVRETISPRSSVGRAARS